MMFEPMSASIGPVRSGKLRALAVTTSERSPALPDVPPLADAVPGFEASAVTGLGVPKGTPAEIDRGAEQGRASGVHRSGMKAKLADTGGAPLPGSAADFAALMAAETEKWGKVVKARRHQGGVGAPACPPSCPASCRASDVVTWLPPRRGWPGQARP